MKKTILVVDDFASVRNFVRESLERKGYSTLGAADGNEALKALSEKTNEVNVVLTDYNMPDCTGYELLLKIKADPSLANIPVIFLTTELNQQRIEKAQQAGVFAWIKKPYRAEFFFDQIESAFRSTQNKNIL